MKNKFARLCISFTLTTLLSCQSDDSNSINLAPESFDIIVSEIQSSKAKLAWTKANDPEGAAVSYDIKLNNKEITTKNSNLQYELMDLENNKTYEVEIIAKDDNNNTTSSKTSFTTNDLPLPSDFEVIVKNVKYSTASLTWDESFTSENNSITYSVYLNNKLVQDNINELAYELNSLNHNTNYIGRLIATADNGKSLIKDFEFVTLENQSPTNFNLKLNDEYSDHLGFAFVIFDFDEAIDPENDSIEYSAFLNGQDVYTDIFEGVIYPDHLNTVSKPLPNKYLRLQNLNGNTTYSLQIQAKDTYGNVSFSNTIQFKTKTTAPNNFEINTYSDGNGNLYVDWNRLTETNFILGDINTLENISIYLLDGEKKSLSKVGVDHYADSHTATFNTSEIPANKEYQLQIVLDWKFNNKQSYSNVATVVNKVYSATSVKGKEAKIYNSGSAYFPLQFTVTFIDSLISEYTDYEITAIRINEYTFDNFVFIEQGATNKGYLTGNITQEQFDMLKNSSTQNSGIEIKDESGYHYINMPNGYSIVN